MFSGLTLDQRVGSSILPRPKGAQMNLEYELTYHATLKEPVVVGLGPFGNRLFFEEV